MMISKEVFSSIPEIIQQQRTFFSTGRTRSFEFRISQLKRLKQAIISSQTAIIDAVKADLGRPDFEAYFELAVTTEINLVLRRLKAWMQPQRVRTSIEQFPSSAWVQPEPLGVVLIIGPWNYPFQLAIWPLVGAIAAGNCAILKPSEQAPRTSAVIAKLIRATFEPYYVAAVEGDAEVSQRLLTEKYDHIFFTGGTTIGRIVMAAAAKHLTPVTLELGGKNPCIVHHDCQIEHAAKRIVWGKFINAGQTCIAPDYLLVHHRIKQSLIQTIQRCLLEFYGQDPSKSLDYGRIVNTRQVNRLSSLLNSGQIITGGEMHVEDCYFAPTILDQVSWDSLAMQDEIFGPILPVLEYENLDEAITRINNRPKPLALYFFSEDKQKQEHIIASTSSGGVGINETVLQVAVSGLPFGGVGDSGMGRYHGKASFDTFSNLKSVFKKGTWLDLKWRYAPYPITRVKRIKRIFTGT